MFRDKLMAVNQENANPTEPTKEVKDLVGAEHLLLVVHGIGDHEEKWKKKSKYLFSW